MDTDILQLKKDGHIATLVLNRPEKRNSLSPDLLLLLARTLEELGREDQIRTVIIRGAGNEAFSSGYDIKAIPTQLTSEEQDKLKNHGPLEIGIQSILNFPYPVVAMLNGYAFGAGCELAACCDLRIGAENVRMGMPPAKLGLVYPLHGLQRFVQLLGLSKTKELFFTGRYYSADRAKEMGLIDYLVPQDELESFVLDLAREMAGNAPLSLKGTKRILTILQESTAISKEGLNEADQIVTHAFNSHDLKEGQKAFLEKRKPVFQGK